MSAKPMKVYHCGNCRRRLKRVQGEPHWIHSSWTNQRYCWPGEGCNKNKRSKP